MKKQTNQSGFAMMEAVVVVMIFMMLTSVLYGLISMEHRRVLARVSEDEAYYAAVSAVRLMEQEVVNGNYGQGTAAHELTRGTGMKKRKTTIVFSPAESKEDLGGTVKIPVTIWTERSEDELLLAAKAESGEKTKIVTMRLVKTQEYSEELVEMRSMIATESEVLRKETETWIPVSYGFEDAEGSGE